MRKALSHALWGILVLVGLYAVSLYSYPLFHGIAEAFSIVIAFGVFMVAWHSRTLMDNGYLLFVGIAYFFIGCIDFTHTLAYKGMGIFRGFDANLPTQLWIAGRYMESLSLLAAPLFFRRKLHPHVVLSLFCAATILLFFSVFSWKIFPDCFIEGKGLTPFKIVSEYIISFFLLCSIYALRKFRDRFDGKVFHLIVWSIIATIISELAFTFYVNVYGISNLIGHYSKILSFYLIYRAVIATGLETPYALLLRHLKNKEEEYRGLFEHMTSGVAIYEAVDDGEDFVFRDFNKTGEAIEHVKKEDIIGKRVTEVFPGVKEFGILEPFRRVWKTGQPEHFPEALYRDKHDPGTWRESWIYALPTGEIVTVYNDITDRKRLEEELLRREVLLNETGRMAKVGGWDFDVETRIQSWTEEVYRIHEVGLDYQPTVEKGIDFYAPDVRPILIEAVQRTIDYGEPFDMELPFITAKGNHRWVHAVGKAYRKEGKTVRVGGTFQDITDRKQAEEALRDSERTFRTLFENSMDAIYITTYDGRFTDFNRAYLDLFGYTREEMATLRAADTYVNPDDRFAFKKAMTENGSVRDYKIKLRKKDGQQMDCVITATIKRTDDGSIWGYEGIIRDVTRQKEMEEKLRALSILDDLTGIYNRRGFLTLAEQQLKIAERSKNGMLLFFADLDHMKEINDTVGHQEGDKALAKVAAILKETFRGSDIIGRIGGDEFAVLVIDAVEETQEIVVSRLRNALEAHNRTDGEDYSLSLSVGIAPYDPESPSSLDEIMAKADMFMYEEKRRKEK